MADAIRNTNCKYAVGDLVFAQSVGYIPWPAILGKYNANRNFWHVIFLATRDHAIIRLNKIWPYDSISKERIVTVRNLEYESFADAIEAADLVVDDENRRLAIAAASYPDTNNNRAVDTIQEEEQEEAVLDPTSIGPNEQGIAPIGQVIAPIEQVIAPIEQVIAPIEQVITPIEQVIAFNEQAADGSHDIAGVSYENAVEVKQNATVAKPQAMQPEVMIVDEERIYETNLIRRLRNQRLSLQFEMHFIDAINEVRRNLRISYSNIPSALQALDHLSQQEISQLMLLRNFECVETIRLLRRYIVNIALTKNTSYELCNNHAGSIFVRYKATLIYTAFKSHFQTPYKKDSFWAEYCYQHGIYLKYFSDPNQYDVELSGDEKDNQNSESSDGIRDEHIEKISLTSTSSGDSNQIDLSTFCLLSPETL